MDMKKLKEDTMQALDEMIDLAEQFYANEKESLAHKRNEEYLEVVEQMISDAKKQREIIAALELEKPGEDAQIAAEKCVDDMGIWHDVSEKDLKVMVSAFQQYADSYHSKKCAECKNKRPTYRPFGLDTPSEEQK